MSIHSNRRAIALLSTTALLGLSACDDTAFNTNHKLAFTTTTGTITVDGNANESAWNDGFEFKMEDGAPQAASTMLGVATATDLYLSFEAKDRTCDEDIVNGCSLSNYPLFAHNDIIVVAFNIDGSNTGYRRLHINPCYNELGGSLTNKCSVNGATVNQPAKITYWTGSWDGSNMTWTSAGNNTVTNGVLNQNSLPANLIASTEAQIVAANIADKPGEGTWTTELRIPRATFPVPSTGNFGFFVDVISSDSWAASATQYSWPTTQQIGGADGNAMVASVESTLVPSKWGVATLDGTGINPGVQLVGFGSNQTDQSKIDLGDNDPMTDDRNEFHATVTNAAASSGSGPSVSNVVATFQIANWGLNNVWTDIPVDATSTTANNPTPGVTLAPREYRTVYSGGWTLTPAQRNDYDPPNQHQCVQVLLSANGAALPNATRQFNMDFAVINSPFDKVAHINLRGNKEFEGAQRVILNEEFVNVPNDIGWKSRFENAEQLGVTQWAMKEAVGKLGFSILADERLRLPLQNVEFSVDSALKGSRIPVRPGSLISLIIDGEFSNGERHISPMGLSGVKQRAEAMSGPGLVMSAEQLARAPFPEGALIGSFDGFRTSFMVTSASSMLVPDGAKELSLMLAGKPAEMLRGAKGGFNIGVIATAVEPYMVQTYPFLAMKRERNDYLLPFGVNLPTYIVRGSVETGKKIRIGNKVYTSRMPAGSFGSYIRAVNQGGLRPGIIRPELSTTGVGVIRADVAGGAAAKIRKKAN